MPGVAINGSQIKETIVPGCITYEIWSWELDNGVRKWVFSEDGETGARITGSVVVPSSKMKIMGENVATVDNITNETWVASPPVPENSRSIDIRNIKPGKSGAGHGKIISGSSKGKLGEKAIALIGSRVETCLGAITTIKDGNEKVKFES
ncbi:hypothetical protein [Paenibacillus sp. TH7-28]